MTTNHSSITPTQYRLSLGCLGLTAVLGLAMIIFGVLFVMEGNASSSWPTAEGKVAGIWVQRDTSDEGTRTYTYEVTYNYTVQGLPYTADRFSLGSGPTASRRFNEEEDARAEAREKYPIGSLVLVSYDPEDPGSAVLQPGADWGTYVPLILGLFFLVGGVAFIYLIVKHNRGRKTAESNLQ